MTSRGAAQPALPSGLDLDAGLSRLGYVAFRPGQREAVETLLAQGRLLLVAPTGGGKSLIYQLPALLLGGTTLVISPLIALMQDQVEALNARGVAATFLASTVESGQMRARMAAAARGEYRLLYVAPERLSFPGFKSVLAGLRCPLVAVDEAHCISEWGHDFRPEYLEIGALLAELSGARVLACTATATPVVRDEILARLGLPADTPQLVRGFARPNLSLRAMEVEGRRERDGRVDAALVEALAGPAAGSGAAIVYAPTRRSAEEEGARLAGLGWRARVYHAGLSPGERDGAQRDFLEGRADVIVATNAFGMGIDRADVRAVVHLGPPSSLEAYYQEVGRAGRDGAPALGLVLISSRDLPLRRALIERGGDGATPDPAVVEHKWGLFLELMRWAEGGSCRHDAILRYFGDEAETLHGCGRCDVCRALVDPGEAHAGEGDEIEPALGEQLFVAARELLCGAEQRLAVVEHIARGALRVHQSLHVAEDPAHGDLVVLEAGLELAQLRAQLRLRDARDAHRLVALQQPLQQVAERIAVLAEEERHLRVDDVARQHRVGVLRHALREHHELRGGRVLARRCAALHAERGHLVGELEERGVVVVDGAHRGTERHQVRLLADHEPGVAIGLAPFGFQRGEHWPHALRGGRQVYAGASAAR